MKKHHTNSIIITKSILGAAQADGMDPKALCKAVGLDPTLLADEEARAPNNIRTLLLLEAIRISGDEHWALRVGELLDPQDSNVAWQIFHSQKTMMEGLESIQTFYRVLSDNTFPKLDFKEKEVKVLMGRRVKGWDWDLPDVELALSVWWRAMKIFGGKKAKLLRVELRSPKPANHQRLEKHFKAPIVFEQPENAMVAPQSILELPNVNDHYNKSLAKLLKNYGKEWIERLDTEKNLVDQVRVAIQKRLAVRRPTLEWMAEQMEVTSRTLQRHLSEEGYKFSELIDEVRRDLAKTYLMDTTLPVYEVCYLLGFSDRNSFYKSFQRWFGTSPMEIRKQITTG